MLIKAVLTCGLLIFFVFMPYLVMRRHNITQIVPNEIIAECSFNENNSIILYGSSFDNVIAFYVNGKWDPEVSVLSQEQGKLEIKLPEDYYNKAGTVEIVLETKKNTEMTAKSNSIKLWVKSSDTILTPEIKEVDPKVISINDNLYHPISVSETNLDENSRLFVNNSLVASSFIDDHIEAYIPSSCWRTSIGDSIKVQVVQEYDGFLTNKRSEVFCFDVDIKGNELLSNEDFMIKYLQSLKREDFIIISSVKDESTCAVTSGITEAMAGTKRNMTENGVHQSYIAILDGQNFVFEELDGELLKYQCTIDNKQISVESANFNVGNMSKIIIDDVDYSLNSEGLNTVVFDKTKDCVRDSVCFKAYGKLDITR